jgi:hypothetical protein
VEYDDRETLEPLPAVFDAKVTVSSGVSDSEIWTKKMDESDCKVSIKYHNGHRWTKVFVTIPTIKEATPTLIIAFIGGRIFELDLITCA